MNALLNYITEQLTYIADPLVYMAESLICGAATYLFYKLVISRVQNYSLQRISLLIFFLIATVFPFITIQISNPAIAEYVIEPVYITTMKASASDSMTNSRMVLNYPIILYFLFSFLFIIRFLFQLFKIYRFKQNCKLLESGPRQNIYTSENIDSPFSFGTAVFMPLSYKGEDWEMSIRHELSHIDRYHTLDIIFVNLLLSIMWFNPFLYIFKRKLIEVHEFQADMDVINSGTNITGYKELLFIAQFSIAPEISNSLHKSLTFKRFFQMENLKQTKASAKMITLFAAAILLLFSITSFSKVAVLPESNELSALEIIDSNELVSLPQDTTSKTVSFINVEIKPKFQGGDENAFTRWVASQLKYPEKAIKDSIQGRVILQFIVSETGKVKNVKVVRGANPDFDKEAMRVVALSPDWEPGMIKGEKVKVVYTFPVIFTLNKKISKSTEAKSNTVPFTMVEVKPKFQGGDENAFTKWVASQLIYPEKAKKDSIQGRVILQFLVSETGKVENVKVVRAANPELDEEAIRVISLSPDWEPGMVKGEKVKVVYTFPVIFQLK